MIEMDDRHGKMIERIYSEVVGDEYTEGLIPKFQRIEKRVNKHDLWFGVVIAMFVALGVIATLVKDVFNLL